MYSQAPRCISPNSLYSIHNEDTFLAMTQWTRDASYPVLILTSGFFLGCQLCAAAGCAFLLSLGIKSKQFFLPVLPLWVIRIYSLTCLLKWVFWEAACRCVLLSWWPPNQAIFIVLLPLLLGCFHTRTIPFTTIKVPIAVLNKSRHRSEVIFAQGLVCFSFECLQWWWRVHDPSGHPVQSLTQWRIHSDPPWLFHWFRGQIQGNLSYHAHCYSTHKANTWW